MNLPAEGIMEQGKSAAAVNITNVEPLQDVPPLVESDAVAKIPRAATNESVSPNTSSAEAVVDSFGQIPSNSHGIRTDLISKVIGVCSP